MRKKLAELINVIFGFRKFILMMILITIGVVFRLMDLISGAEVVDLFKNTAIAFFSANGLEHLTNTVQAYIEKKASKASEADSGGSEQTEAEAADNAQSEGAKS